LSLDYAGAVLLGNAPEGGKRVTVKGFVNKYPFAFQ
jgi:hypothetical protein